MPHITIEKKKLEQALEALKRGVREMNIKGCTLECMPLHEAITAIKEALRSFPDGEAHPAVALEQELFSAPNNFYKDVDEAINKLEKNGSIFDGNDSAPYVVWLLRTLRELATQTQPKNPEPVVWKHDCAALLTNDVELWIDRCHHCGKPRTSPQQPPHPKEPDNEFKNFHRSLCERFGYVHDEKDWKRDLVSLEEWIAKKVQPEQEPAFYAHDGYLMTPERAKFLGFPLDSIIALYTSPPQRNPLTDKQIVDWLCEEAEYTCGQWQVVIESDNPSFFDAAKEQAMRAPNIKG